MRLAAICALVLALGNTALGWSEAEQDPGDQTEKVLQALRITEKITLDGKLDEASWALPKPAQGFIQSVPDAGEAATEQTEVWVLYDDENIYIGAYCYDSQAPENLTVNDLRVDFSTRDSDVFEVALDTFNDKRNGFLFGTNPQGAKFDGQFGQEGQNFNRDWDGLWDVKVQVRDDGWVVEMAFPLKTLRFNTGDEQVWGINFLRRLRRRNEDSFWSPIPRAFRITRVSLAGALQGLSALQQGNNFRVKPYLSVPVTRLEGDDTDIKPDVGADFKYGLTSGLTLDATINTDFSQVEADEERINLTRFSLFFPEKREFFLENSSIFEFGRSRRGPGGGRRRDVIPFFSRRIGIDSGDIIPIIGGGRVTGRAGKYTIGALSMQQAAFDRFDEDWQLEELPSTNFTVGRIRRDILRQSNVGGIFVNRQELGGSYNRTFGADATFNFVNYLDIGAYYLKTDTPEYSDEEQATNLQIGWDDDLWNLQASYTSIEENFNPEVGFAPRTGIRKTRGEFGYTPRPGERISFIRQWGPSIQGNYITDQEGRLETREIEGRFRIDFPDGSNFSVGPDLTFERLDEDFVIFDPTPDIEPDEDCTGQGDEICVLAGDYNFNRLNLNYSSDRSRVFSGNVRFGTGEFFNGDRSTYQLGLRVQPGYRFRTDISWDHNQVKLPTGEFDTDLMAARFSYSFNTEMFLNGLVQYNSATGEIVSNIRYNFIYRPLSDIFVVYNERRASGGEVLDRALIVKVTYLLAF